MNAAIEPAVTLPVAIDALRAFVKAEGEWQIEKRGMPPGTFDDPLGDAYAQAVSVLADYGLAQASAKVSE